MKGRHLYRHSWITVGTTGRLIWRCLKCNVERPWKDVRPDAKGCQVQNAGSRVSAVDAEAVSGRSPRLVLPDGTRRRPTPVVSLGTKTVLKRVREIPVFGERLLRLMGLEVRGKAALKVRGEQQTPRGSTDNSVVRAKKTRKPRMQQKSRAGDTILHDVHRATSNPRRKSKPAVTVVHSMTPDQNALPKSGGSAGEWSDRSRTPGYHHGGE